MAAGVAVFFGDTLEFGGKRSATPLWISPAKGWDSVPRQIQSGVVLRLPPHSKVFKTLAGLKPSPPDYEMIAALR
jgi:hypothetical protein